MPLKPLFIAALIAASPFAVTAADTSNTTKGKIEMALDNAREAEVRQSIDDLIQTATTYDVATLDRIYHDTLNVVMIDSDHNLSNANKEGFKGLFAAKRDAGDPPMNTWAKFHSIYVNGDDAHVLLSRKNDLSGVNMDLTLSIDLIFEDERWQVTREVIFLRPEEQPS